MNDLISFPFIKERPIDVICMGRVAVDLYAEDIGLSLKEAVHFKKYLGGCAGNIAVGASRLGLTSMMLSQVGQDEMGSFIKETLCREGVRTDLLYETANHLTGLVLLGVKPPNDFPLMFYRENCADMQLKREHVVESLIQDAKALLITGTGLSKPEIRDTTYYATHLAIKQQTAVIMDLDYRPVLWGLTAKGDGETRFKSSAQVTQTYQHILPLCSLLVGTEDEFCIAGGEDDLDLALQKIRTITNASLLIKLGEEGSVLYVKDHLTPIKGRAFPVEVLNVLGAGDAFMAGFLRGALTGCTILESLTFANACGALVVTRHGCAPAMPSRQELVYFLDRAHRDHECYKSQALKDLHKASTVQDKQTVLIKKPHGVSFGKRAIVDMNTALLHGEMNFSSIKLAMGDSYQFNPEFEYAALLLTGRVQFDYPGESKKVMRLDYFQEPPIVLHCAAGTDALVTALSDVELLLIETRNEALFSPTLFDKHTMLELDNRGMGLLENTSYRQVRTVFDKRNRPQSNLVVGEIITFPGRWSSYPPHYHSQPEIYHYRFSEPQGFSFAEHGEEVLRIEHGDTYQILNGGEHAHAVAPGYALYTLWFIRHLPLAPYHVPVFREEHDWTRQSESNWRVWHLDETFT